MSSNMTYGDLLQFLKKAEREEEDPSILMQTITIFVPGDDEYYPGTIAFTDDDCDVLDPGHMILTTE